MFKKKDIMVDHTIYFNHRKPWTKEQDRLLLELSETYPDRQIAEQLGRTVASLWRRRHVLQGQDSLQLQ